VKALASSMRHDDDRHVKRLLSSRMSSSIPAAMMGSRPAGRLVEEKNFGIHSEGAGDGCATFSFRRSIAKEGHSRSGETT